MTTLVLSIAPQYVERILTGEKRYELRTRPPALASPTAALIYATRPTSAVVARVALGPVTSLAPSLLWRRLSHLGCSRIDFDRYFAGRRLAHAIAVTDVRPVQPIPMDVMLASGFRPPQSWGYWHSTPPLLCPCGHPLDEHNEDGCMYPDPARPSELAFCPCGARHLAPLAVP